MNNNVLILANGKGTRFKDDYPDTPKPLIRYKNLSLIDWAHKSILDSSLAKNHNITVISNSETTLKHAETHLKCNAFKIKPTNSPAETLLESSKIWNYWENFYTVDCDVAFKFSVSYDNKEHFLPTAISSNPAYSYVEIKESQIINILEKKVISNNAVIGVYPFNTAMLKQYFNGSLYRENYLKREIYLSDLLRYQISKGMRIRPIICDEFKPLGVPSDLN